MFEPAQWRPYELQPLSCVQYLSIDETPKISLTENQSPPGPTVPPEVHAQPFQPPKAPPRPDLPPLIPTLATIDTVCSARPTTPVKTT